MATFVQTKHGPVRISRGVSTIAFLIGTVGWIVFSAVIAAVPLAFAFAAGFGIETTINVPMATGAGLCLLAMVVVMIPKYATRILDELTEVRSIVETMAEDDEEDDEDDEFDDDDD